MNFGTTLYNLRKERNLSMRELAKESDVSQAYISQIENNKRNTPNIIVLKKLAKGLGVNEIDLMYEAGYINEEDQKILKETDEMLKSTQWVQASPEEIKKMISDQKNLLKDKEFNIEDLLTDDYHIRFKGRLLAPEEKQKILKLIDISFN